MCTGKTAFEKASGKFWHPLYINIYKPYVKVYFLSPYLVSESRSPSLSASVQPLICCVRHLFTASKVYRYERYPTSAAPMKPRVTSKGSRYRGPYFDWNSSDPMIPERLPKPFMPSTSERFPGSARVSASVSQIFYLGQVTRRVST